MNKAQQSLKDRYQVHPLIFQRALESSSSDGELFDILEDLPDTYPIVWDEKKRRFVTCDNFMLQENQ